MEDVNSIGKYIQSITRASGFRDLRPRLRQVLLGDDEEVTAEHRHLNHHETNASSNVGHGEGPQAQSGYDHRSRVGTDHEMDEETPLIGDRRSSRDSDHCYPKLAPLRSKVQGSSLGRIEELARQRDETRAQTNDDQREPLLVTKVRRDDGTEAEVSDLSYVLYGEPDIVFMKTR